MKAGVTDQISTWPVSPMLFSIKFVIVTASYASYYSVGYSASTIVCNDLPLLSSTR